MAFGQQQGRPASAKQVQYLLALLQAAGHEGFRDARGPMGFTQRQAGGKFTVDEASSFIDQLTSATELADDVPPAPAPPPSAAPALPAPPKTVRSIRDIPDDRLVAELERRGWTVTPPG
jgi:hypothetical protein